MEIIDKITLHNVLDEMISMFPKSANPKEIAICRSLVIYDKSLEKELKYKGIKITIYSEWFADGKIAIT